ncbi:hypothetical protein BaRGS_00001407 [Batillaria attramentaria]|uniref:Uncharacterized protein n=1 Tax=Batillaria attramentaria TaxID=370345 RepID=A0ABD0M7H7_9CAEN
MVPRPLYKPPRCRRIYLSRGRSGAKSRCLLLFSNGAWYHASHFQGKASRDRLHTDRDWGLAWSGFTVVHVVLSLLLAHFYTGGTTAAPAGKAGRSKPEPHTQPQSTHTQVNM